MPPTFERKITVERAVYTLKNFEEAEALKKDVSKPWAATAKQKLTSQLICTKECFGNCLLNRLPFINVVRSYKRAYIGGDIIAGLTVGVVRVLLGMGMALLSKVPPIYGIYTSLFHVVTYFFFGTSRHLSAGVMPLLSIMIGDVVEREYSSSLAVAPPGGTSWNQSNSSSPGTPGRAEEEAIKVGLATSLSLLCGIIQLGMSLLHLDFLSLYMSQPFVGGFTTGVAVHIITSQMKVMLGMNVKLFIGPFKLFYIWAYIFSNITNVNIGTLITSVISLTSLILTRSFINERFKSKLLIPIPIELIVIIIATLLSHYCHLEEEYGVQTVGPLPLGIPAPVVPPLWNLSNYIIDAVIMAIVGYGIAISTAKVFTKKYRYEINPNQELFALGLCNTVSAFFTGFAGCGSLPRSLLQDSSGGKTQVASVYMVIVLLIDILVIGYLLQPLPNCILGTIITFAVLPMFSNVYDLRRLWPISKVDYSIWLTTFLAVIVLDIDYGLGVGIGFSVLTVLAKIQVPKSNILGRVNITDIYQPNETYTNLRDVVGVRIFKFYSPLFFGNAELLKREMYLKVLNPNECREQVQLNDDKVSPPAHTDAVYVNSVFNCNDEFHNVGQSHGDGDMMEQPCQVPGLGNIHIGNELVSDGNEIKVHTIILDCSCVSYMDSVGVNTLRQIFEDYKEVNVLLLLANCNQWVLEVLDKSGYCDEAGRDSIYVTLHDAVVYSQQVVS